MLPLSDQIIGRVTIREFNVLINGWFLHVINL